MQDTVSIYKNQLNLYTINEQLWIEIIKKIPFTIALKKNEMLGDISDERCERLTHWKL